MTSDGVVVVTGAAGFLGRACVSAFASRGGPVVALVHRREFSSEGQGGEGSCLSVVRADIRDGRSLEAALRPWRGRIRTVVHCAAHASDLGPGRLFRETNYEGVLAVGRIVAEEPGARLVHLSTTDVYGLCDFCSADEDTPFDPRPRNPYPRFKILAERALRRLLPPEKLSVLRPGAVWGPGDEVILPRVLAYLRSASSVVHFGRWRGRNRWPAAFVVTVALAARAAAEAPEAGGSAFNVVDPEPLTADEYFRIVLETCLPEKAGIPSRTLPLWAGWTAGALSTGLSRALGRTQPLFEPTLYGLRSASCNLHFDGTRLVALLASRGEAPVPRHEALARFRCWVHRQAKEACADAPQRGRPAAR